MIDDALARKQHSGWLVHVLRPVQIIVEHRLSVTDLNFLSGVALKASVDAGPNISPARVADGILRSVNISPRCQLSENIVGHKQRRQELRHRLTEALLQYPSL